MSNTGSDTQEQRHSILQNSTETCSPDPIVAASRKGSILISKPITATPSPISTPPRADSAQSPAMGTYERKMTGNKGRRRSRLGRRSLSALTEASNWHGRDRVKLVKKGYQSLALICTFIAGVQAQLLQMSYNQTDYASQIVNSFFFAGLFFDIGAAILSALSARWYEMLTPEEAEHVYDWVLELGPFNASSPGADNKGEQVQDRDSKEAGNKQEVGQVSIHIPILEAQIPSMCKPAYWTIERWIYLGLKAGIIVAPLGLGFLAAGVMIYVWTHTSLIVQLPSTISCVFLVLLLPPFFLRHDRIQTMTYVKLQRHSG